MSGGVDSSVAALLLQQQGFEVIGVFMHFWAENTSGNTNHPAPQMRGTPPLKGGDGNKCCSLASFNDARRVANKLDIPLYTVNFDRPFKKQVVDSFLAGYKKGETPNPCVECNRYIKFELLLKKADELGADFIATGHYAKSICRRGKYILSRPKDADKDQTYFLYTLGQKKLARTLFPLADLTKPAVRALAKKAGLTVAGKAESQEICFIPGKSHNDFLKRHLKMKPGVIKLLTPSFATNPPRHSVPPLQGGESVVLGRHQGLPLYTIGQRKGVEIGGIGPFYVARCDYKTNTLYVVKNGEDKTLYSKKLVAREVNWINGSAPKTPFRALVVIRYRHAPVAATIDKTDDNRIIVRFSKPQRAITPGQSVVFYKGREVLGGGVINE